MAIAKLFNNIPSLIPNKPNEANVGENSCCDLSIWEIYYILKLWLDDSLLSWLLAFLGAILLGWAIWENHKMADWSYLSLTVQWSVSYVLYFLPVWIIWQCSSITVFKLMSSLFVFLQKLTAGIPGGYALSKSAGEDLWWEVVLNGAMCWSSCILLLSCSAGDGNASDLSHLRCGTLVHSW